MAEEPSCSVWAFCCEARVLLSVVGRSVFDWSVFGFSEVVVLMVSAALVIDSLLLATVVSDLSEAVNLSVMIDFEEVGVWAVVSLEFCSSLEFAVVVALSDAGRFSIVAEVFEILVAVVFSPACCFSVVIEGFSSPGFLDCAAVAAGLEGFTSASD